MKKVFGLLLALPAKILFSQADSSMMNLPTEAVAYQTGSEALYSGLEHRGYMSKIEGNAYYLSDGWQPGSIVYRDVLYPAVQLKYDLYRDEVIVRHFNGFTGVTLFTPRIASFRLQNKNFVNLPAPAGNSSMPAGIYEVLAEGEFSLLARRTKKLEETIRNIEVERRFVATTTYFISKDGAVYPVRKESQVLQLTGEKKAAVRAYLRENKIRFKADPEAALLKIVDYYNSLSTR